MTINGTLLHYAGRSPIWRRRSERLWRVPRHRGLPRIQSPEGGVRGGAMERRRPVASPVRPTHQRHSELHAPPKRHDLGAPIEVRNAAVIHASSRTRVGPADRCRTLAVVVARLSVVRLESPTSAASVVFRWKAHPVELRSAVVKSERPHCFAITADGSGVHAERTFTLRTTPDGSSTVVVSHETQVGLLPWLGRASPRRGCMRSTKRCSTT